ncbi:hypothetical protein [Rhodohalobacter halophilus]|uniref:hypothetical protein n=1 Tax=Rhodohalobacter halophilus TaxID=1812810 RepID=UPI00114D1C2C|nr:hypothetical protein [Rhodohalobacter halophilus]
MRRFSYITTLFAIAGSLLLMSCSNTTGSFEDQPPHLPPAESMNMDFSLFEDENSDTGKENLSINNESYSHFLNAAVRAAVLKTIVDVNLIIPKSLYIAAENADPELNEDGEWTWTYSSQASGNTFNVRLVASESNGAISWQMYLTGSAMELDNILLFDGEVSPDGTEGRWTYYAIFCDHAGSAVSRVDWSVDNEENLSLRLEVLSDRNGNLGDYIEYIFDAPVKTATYYNAGEDQLTEIEWNSETKAGFLIAPNYNNGEQACWDSNFQNVECG